MTTLPHYKWERLDKLLCEMGLGGYYDTFEQLLGTLQHILDAIGAEERKTDEIIGKLKDSNDLQEIIVLLQHFSNELDTTNLLKQLQNQLVDLVIERKCIICGTRLDANLERVDWQIPLCREHRRSHIKRRRKNILRAIAEGNSEVSNPYELLDKTSLKSVVSKPNEGENDEKEITDTKM